MLTKRSFDSTERWAGILTPGGIDGSSACAADVNGDTLVDQDDIDDILEHWPTTKDEECPINVICRWDVNGDYLINATDIYLVNNSWCLGGSLLMESESAPLLTLAELIARVYLTNHDAETQAEINVALIENWE